MYTIVVKTADQYDSRMTLHGMFRDAFLAEARCEQIQDALEQTDTFTDVYCYVERLETRDASSVVKRHEGFTGLLANDGAGD